MVAAFLGVIDVIQAQADEFTRPRNDRQEIETLERQEFCACRRRVLSGSSNGPRRHLQKIDEAVLSGQVDNACRQADPKSIPMARPERNNPHDATLPPAHFLYR